MFGKTNKPNVIHVRAEKYIKTEKRWRRQKQAKSNLNALL